MAVAAKRRSTPPAAGAPKTGAPRNSVAAARGRSSGRAAGRRTSGAAGGGVQGWWEGFKSIAGTIAIFLVIRAFLVEAYRIPSESMVPTLLIGDWLFVNKLVYGPNIPFTHVNLPGYSDPHRGDVVVFESPYQADEAERGDDPTPTLVKRLVGMPGDTLYMRRGLLYVDGIAQRQGYGTLAKPEGYVDTGDPLFDWQKRYALAASRFGTAPGQPTHDEWGPIVVPAGHYFMMGDNRYNSKDSRYWGLVPRANVRGRPIFVYYSYNNESDRPVPFITDIRWGRIGHVIR